MKLALWLSLLLPSILLGQNAPPKDILYREVLGPIAGTILRADATSFTVEMQLIPGQTTGQTSIPRQGISKIEFAPNPQLEGFLESVPREKIGELASLWRSRESLLSIANSPVGAIGLKLAEFLVTSDSLDQQQQAFDLYQRLEKEDWDETRRALARQGKLRAMVATGRAADAVLEAKSVAQSSEDPAVLIEANYVLAEAAHAALKKLVEENPRWEEDTRVRPEFHRFYNEAFDLYLYPYLFHGAQEATAARGLWGAVRLQKTAGRAGEGRALAEDLVFLYPNCVERAEAEQFLKDQPATEETNHEPNQET